MEAIIRTNDRNLFDRILYFLQLLPVTIETKEEKTLTKKVSKGLDLNSFSFFQSMEATKGIKGSLSDAVIEERRSE